MYSITVFELSFCSSYRYVRDIDVFELGIPGLHDQNDEISIIPNTDLALYLNRNSNRYSRFYVISATLKVFSRISTSIRSTTWLEKR